MQKGASGAPAVRTGRPVTFRARGQVHQADTCMPLVQAAESGQLRFDGLGRGTYPGRRLPKGVLPGLRSLGFWDARVAQDWGLGLHRNEGIELTFLESGSMPVTVERRKATMGPDQLLITRPWQPHQLGDPDVGVGRLAWAILDVGVRHPHQAWRWPSWLVLTPTDLTALTRYLRHNEQLLWDAPADVRRCFQVLCQAIEADRRGSHASRIAVTINDLLLLLLDLFRSSRIRLSRALTSSRRSVELFLKELPGRLSDPWTLEGMAEKCGVGVTRFVHHCRKITNRAPMKHLNHLRVDEACRLLRERDDRNITEVALSCGFTSSQYFANVFRSQVGVSPRAYRKQAGES